MRRALAVFSAAVLFFVATLAAMAALGARPWYGPDDDGTASALDGAAALLRERHEASSDPGERAGLEAIASLVDQARASAASGDYARESLARGLSAFAASAALVAALILAALWAFTMRRVALPISRLARAMEAEPDDARPAPPPDRALAEIGSLYASFNALVRRLDEYRARIRAAERETFGRFMVHEVKNALTPIPLALRVLDSPGDPGRESAALIIRGQLAALDALLDRFRLSYRFPEPRLAPCDLLVLARGAPYVADGRVSLECEAPAPSESAPPAAPPAPQGTAPSAALTGFATMADERLLRQALDNLVGNALEACQGRPGAGVTVRLRRSAGGLCLDVVDTGAGMGEAVASRVFEEWFTTKPKGMGLGLALARRVAEAHGGSLGFATKEGEGSTFTMELPGKDAP